MIKILMKREITKREINPKCCKCKAVAHQLTDNQPVPEQWHPGLYTEHDAISYGISLWSAGGIC